MLTNTREMTSGYRLQQWADLMQKHSESGLSVKSFCEEIGIKEHRYYYWQRKLRVAANEKLTNDQNEMTGLVPARNGAPVVWAQVSVNSLSTTSSQTSNNIKIYRDGWTVTVEPGFDSGALTEALRAVSRSCC